MQRRCRIAFYSVEAINIGQSTDPRSIYEYYKSETELFLKHVSNVRPDMEHRVWRLPLVFGGESDNKRHSPQFIPWFIEQYKSGAEWSFSESEFGYGTSWVNLPDLLECWLTKPRETGFKTFNVPSGFETYADMHRVFRERGWGGPKPLRLFRSRSETVDDTGIIKRNLFDFVS